MSDYGIRDRAFGHVEPTSRWEPGSLVAAVAAFAQYRWMDRAEEEMAVAARICTSPPYDVTPVLGYLVNQFQEVTCRDGFDAVLDQLYDIADRKRIWLGF